MTLMRSTAFAVVLAAAALLCEQSDKPRRNTSSSAVGRTELVQLLSHLADPMAQRADSLVRAGRPWRATVLLAPLVTSPASATSEVRLAAARGAAAWDGWAEVDRLLRDAPWLDDQFSGEGRELLARSELERGIDARANTQLALADARDNSAAPSRRVLLARAFDRANQRDSAAAEYLAAATRLPRSADWLRLRAAGVTDDSTQRSALFAHVVRAPAKARITMTDAQARERSSDFTGAAIAFRKAGSEGSALRVEAASARDDGARTALRQRVVRYLATNPSAGDVRQALDILDKLGPLATSDELIVSRAAANASAPRSVAGFTRASTASPLSASDRMIFAGALARAGKPSDAIREYATITDDATLAPSAAYQRARLLAQSGDATTARSALRSVAMQYGAVRTSAAPALLLLADLQVDAGDLTGASQSLGELLTRDPSASQAQLARFRLGLIRWTESPASAASEFDSLVALFPSSDETQAARYWAARAYEQLGKRSEAEEQWRTIIRTAPTNYYAMRAAQRLRTIAWTPPSGPDSVAHVASVDSTVQRIVELERLGMDVEAHFEVDALAERGDHTPGDAAVVAQALQAVGEPARALRLALSAIEHGTVTRSLYLAAYPIVHGDALTEESKRNNLDPALVAGLIRQESSWNPRAVSVASARGLMQLLPSVGASIAAGKKYPLWNTALLFEPDVSLELGTAHLASSLRRDTPPERALAAYNAGASRVTRWTQRPGVDDAELFTEWVPFTETRDYVRVVLRNAEIYRALYGLK